MMNNSDYLVVHRTIKKLKKIHQFTIFNHSERRRILFYDYFENHLLKWRIFNIEMIHLSIHMDYINQITDNIMAVQDIR